MHKGAGLGGCSQDTVLTHIELYHPVDGENQVSEWWPTLLGAILVMGRKTNNKEAPL